MKVSLWSWTDARLSCGVLWKSFQSLDNGQNTAMTTILKYPKMLPIKTCPDAGEVDSLDCISRNMDLSFQCRFPLSFIRQLWSCSFPDFTSKPGLQDTIPVK